MRKLTQAETTAVSGGCIPSPWPPCQPPCRPTLPGPIFEPRPSFSDIVMYRFVDRNNPLRPPAEPVVPRDRLLRHT